MQTKFFDYALGGRDGSSQPSSSSSAGTKRLDAFTDYESQIGALQRLRADTTLSQEQRQRIDDKYFSIIDRLCMNTSDLTQ
jgi:hypothetical protein